MSLFTKLSFKRRIVAFSVSGLIVFAIFFLFNARYIQYKDKATREIESIFNLQKSIVELRNSSNTFIAGMLNNNDAVYTAINNHIRNVEEHYVSIMNRSDSMNYYSAFAKDSTLLKVNLELKNEVTEFYNLYQDLIVSYKERGTLSNSYVKNWNRTGDEIVEAIYETEDIDLMTEVVEIRKLEKEYLIFSEPETLETLKSKANSLNEMVSFMYIDKVYKVGSLVKQYLKTADQIALINTRLGIGAQQGISQQLAKSGERLITNIDNLNQQVETKYQKQQNIAFRTLLISYVIVALGLVVLFIVMGVSFLHPLGVLKMQFEKMIKGEHPKPIAISGKGDIFKIFNDVNGIVDTLNVKKDFAIRLGKGEYDAEYSLLSKKDILGKSLLNIQSSLQMAHEEHQKHINENKTRRYINEGLAKFGDIMRRHSSDMGELASIFIQELVKYLDAIQGGLFFVVKEKDEQYLELKGAFAYNRKKYINKKVLFGEGLVGTCAVEKKPIKPRNIPENYIEITSGLGDALPTNLVLFPVLSEGVLEGVIEIAAIREFEDYQMEFLDELSTSLGTALHGIKINAQTAVLLKKSQEQAAEMAEQEEEMRQNMEELQATQEEAARREEEMNGFISSVKSSIPLFEFTKEGVVSDANNLFAQIIGKESSDDVINSMYSDFFRLDEGMNSFIDFWEVLAREEIIKRTIKISTPTRKEVYLKQNFNLIYNFDGDLSKVLCLVEDITDIQKKEIQIKEKEETLAHDKYEVDILKGLFDTTIARADFKTSGEVELANKHFCKFIGLQEDEVLNKNYHDFLNKAEIERFEGIWDDMKNRKQNISSLVMRTKPNGDVVWLSATFTPVIVKGTIERIILLANNITENIKRITS
jgi:PAS domain S-box-containing protein